MLHFGPINIKTELFVLVILLLVLALQILLCAKVKRRVLRLLPVCLLGGATAIFLVLALLTEDWDSLGFLILGAVTAGLLATCGLGFAIWTIFKRIRQTRNHKE